MSNNKKDIIKLIIVVIIVAYLVGLIQDKYTL
jgi:hypothetical protein